ncbi:MAG: hypothetical protein OWV35_09470, partial [Firmicutes bacterium]|nr:hypothetical protein [Bacillota bacterium]
MEPRTRLPGPLRLAAIPGLPAAILRRAGVLWAALVSVAALESAFFGLGAALSPAAGAGGTPTLRLAVGAVWLVLAVPPALGSTAYAFIRLLAPGTPSPALRGQAALGLFYGLLLFTVTRAALLVGQGLIALLSVLLGPGGAVLILAGDAILLGMAWAAAAFAAGSAAGFWRPGPGGLGLILRGLGGLTRAGTWARSLPALIFTGFGFALWPGVGAGLGT